MKLWLGPIMVRTYDNYNSASKSFMFWLIISLFVVVILHIILPFPVSFIVSIIANFCLGMYRDDRALRKAGKGGIKGWYKSVFSSGFVPRADAGINGSAYQPLKFSCINCGNEHNKIACPNCGSKGVRPV